MTKTERLKQFILNEQWDKALSLASKFHELGNHKDAIIGGHSARTNPSFYKQIGKDPDKMFTDGITALKERYHYFYPSN